jgi:hypothetical protein
LAEAEASGAPEAPLRKQVREKLRQHDALRGVDFNHVEAAVRALARGRSGHFWMGDGLEVTIEKGQLTVHRENR